MPTLLALVLVEIGWQISSSFFFVLRLQIPAGENPREPIAFVLKNQPQPSAAVRHTIQNVDIAKTTLVPVKSIFVKKTLLGFFRLDAVIAQMLDVAVFLLFIIPFELGPAISRHESITRHPYVSLAPSDPLRHPKISHLASADGTPLAAAVSRLHIWPH